MRYLDFRKKIEEIPLFETKELRVILGDDFIPSMLTNLKNWEKKEYILMLRRGVYVLAEEARNIDTMIFAGKIYAPSYISMETALGFYGIIPEAVFTITSVTTRKTKEFQTPVGNFSYQKIKKDAYGGYETKAWEKFSFNIAVPEKAVADFLYLNRNILNGSREQFKEYRFNENFAFDAKKILSFSRIFGNKKTFFLAQEFIKTYVAK